MELSRQQQEAFHKAAYLCSRAEICSGHMLKKLLAWGVKEDDAERYARSYVRDKFRFNKWGKIKIAYQLRMSRVGSEIIDAALSEIDEEAYAEVLFKMINEKNRGIHAVNPYDRKAKLLRFAQSRGFETDLVYPVVDEVLKS